MIDNKKDMNMMSAKYWEDKKRIVKNFPKNEKKFQKLLAILNFFCIFAFCNKKIIQNMFKRINVMVMVVVFCTTLSAQITEKAADSLILARMVKEAETSEYVIFCKHFQSDGSLISTAAGEFLENVTNSFSETNIDLHLI